MAESTFQKSHTAIMEMEKGKNKLHAEIEQLQKEHNELVSTLSDLRKRIVVDKGDYKLIEAERIAEMEELDNKIISLRLEVEEKQNSSLSLSNTANSLLNSIEATKKEVEKQEFIKKELMSEIELYTKTLNKIKQESQDEESKKREILSSLSKEVDIEQEKLRIMKEEYEQKRFEILKDERLLSIKRSDLQIYEARMRKKYPNEAFVLKNDLTSTT